MALFGFDSTNIVNNALGALSGAAQSAATNEYNSAIAKVSSALGPLGAQITSAVSGSWLSRAINRPDPHINIDWSIILPNDNSNVSYYVEEVNPPITQLTVSPGIFRGGQRIYLPTSFEDETLHMSFYEDRLATASQYLQNWMQSVGDRGTGLMNYPSEYKKNITIVLQDTMQNTIMSLIYYGCWPTKLDGINLVSAQAGRTIIGATFSLDGMAINFNGGLVENAFALVTGKLAGATASFNTSISNLEQSVGNSIINGIGSIL